MSANVSRPSLSIVIPSLNSPIIDEVVEALLRQDGLQQADEILVIGKDNPGLVPQHPQVRLLDTGDPVNAPRARNLGINAAGSELLLLLDSDCLARPGWLAAHLAMQAAGYPVVGGGVELSGQNYWHLTYNLTMFHDVAATAAPGPRPFLPTLNLAVRREVIAAVGPLDETLSNSEDLDWTTRMRENGYQPYFQPAAAVEHRHNRRTLAEVWQDSASRGYYARQVRLRHRQSLHTPFALRYRWLTLALAPVIAAVITGRIVARLPATMRRHWATLPAIYLTKIAWCWGASRR